MTNIVRRGDRATALIMKRCGFPVGRLRVSGLGGLSNGRGNRDQVGWVPCPQLWVGMSSPQQVPITITLPIEHRLSSSTPILLTR